MDTNKLFLKIIFCCSACDGDIAPEELLLVKNITSHNPLFESMDVEKQLNSYILTINAIGKQFINNCLNEVSDANLTKEEQLNLIDLVIKMIEADNRVLYSEVKFFKKFRQRLSVSDDDIIEEYPKYEDYLLPDISVDTKDFDEIGNFEIISFA